MQKIKNTILNNMLDFKESFKTYKATYLLTIVMTLVLAIVYDNDFIKQCTNDDIFEHSIIFYGCAGCFIWLCEVVLKKCWLKIIGYMIGIVIGVSGSIAYVNGYLKGNNQGIERMILGYVAAVMCLGIFFVVRKLKIKFSKYVLDVIQDVFNYTIMYIVVNIGVTFLVFIFDALIWKDSFEFIFTRTQILLLGLFYMILLILAFTKKKTRITVFFSNMIKYILYSILLIALVIVYMYLIKIVITVTMPVNVVYGIVAAIFIGGFVTVLMLENLNVDNNFYKKTLKIVPYMYIPLFVMQIIAISIRCKTYGLTVTRYLGIMFVIIEIALLILYIYKKKNIVEYIMLVCMVIIIIVTLTPFNYEQVAVRSQVSRLQSVWKKGEKYIDLKKDEKSIALNVYDYIENELLLDAKDYLPTYISKEDIKVMHKEIGTLDMNTIYNELSIWYEIEISKIEIDVSKYKKIKVKEGAIGEYYKDYMSKGDKKVEEVLTKVIDKAVKDDEIDNIEQELGKQKMYKYNDEKDILVLSLEGIYSNDDGKIYINDMNYEVLILEKMSK